MISSFSGFVDNLDIFVCSSGFCEMFFGFRETIFEFLKFYGHFEVSQVSQQNFWISQISRNIFVSFANFPKEAEGFWSFMNIFGCFGFPWLSRIFSASGFNE